MAGDSLNSPLEISSPSSSTSPNKRLKTTTPELKSDIQSELSELSDRQYGPREPQELSKDDEFGYKICGICLVDSEKSVVGRIDSCDHSFCFVCIMEWAKVESRCPMCKRRFTNIRRPPKVGVFPCERVVNVPQRDQVYNLSGNSTVTRSAPYEDTHCTVCLGTTEENLLLLCDLCDSAAHTYCVGLGRTVPEGDWFCQDCAVSRAEHEKAETAIETENNIMLEESVTPLADPLLVISDIVRESDVPPIVRKDLPRMNRLPSSVPSGCKRAFAAGENMGGKKAHKSPVGEPGESCARTLCRCRNVQTRIRTLRKQWNSFRNGSLSFSSISGFDRPESSSEKCDNNLGPVFDPARQGTSNSCGSGLSGWKNDPYDTDKAWKILEMAKRPKPVKQNAGKGICQFPEVLSGKRIASEQPLKIRSGVHLSEKQQIGASSSGNYIPKKQFKPNFHVNKLDKENFQLLGKQKQIPGFDDAQSRSSSLEDSVRPTPRASDPPRKKPGFVSYPSSSLGDPEVKLRSEERSAGRQSRKDNDATCIHGSQEQRNLDQKIGSRHLIIQQNNPSSSSQLHECTLPRQVQSKMGDPHTKRFVGSMHRIYIESDGQSGACLLAKSSVSIVGPSNLSKRKLEVKSSSSSSKPPVMDGKLRSGKDPSEKRGSKSDDAKSEVQSLVKLHLKLLSKGNHLEVKTFKEIARVSTHTILAACGIEHPRPGIHPIPSTICNHTNRIQQLSRSRLMPGSCRECFHAFAYEIVKSVMGRKITP